jgi:PAS domain S-box-containing protein
MPSPLWSVADELREVVRSGGESPIKTRLRMAIQKMSVPVVVTDDQARFVLVNDAALELTGYSERELLRLSVPDITAASDEPHTDALWNAFQSHGQQHGRYDIRTKDGASVTVEYVAIANIASGMHLSVMTPAVYPP